MTPEERQLISGLFDRMRTVGPVEKDRDAEALISQSVRQIPDAAYMLVQSVLVQDVALQQADQRIRDLENQLGEGDASEGAPRSSGGFLGGLFGGGGRTGTQPGAGARGSVPAMPRQSPAFGGAQRGGPQSPWGPQAGQQQQPAQGAMGGGFMRSAMATAAGVAGGMLLADGIRNMMNGSGESGTAQAASENQPASNDADKNDAPQQDDVQDASHDDSSDWGGGDMEI